MFGVKETHDVPILYNLSLDPSEQYNIAEDHPEVIELINKFVKDHQKDLKPGKDQLVERE